MHNPMLTPHNTPLLQQSVLQLKHLILLILLLLGLVSSEGTISKRHFLCISFTSMHYNLHTGVSDNVPSGFSTTAN